MRVTKRFVLSVLVFFTLADSIVLTTHAAPADSATASPRLVLQITVDQLRGDMLPHYRDRFGPSGFRRLTDRGLYYSNAAA